MFKGYDVSTCAGCFCKIEENNYLNKERKITSNCQN